MSSRTCSAVAAPGASSRSSSWFISAASSTCSVFSRWTALARRGCGPQRAGVDAVGRLGDGDVLAEVGRQLHQGGAHPLGPLLQPAWGGRGQRALHGDEGVAQLGPAAADALQVLELSGRVGLHASSTRRVVPHGGLARGHTVHRRIGPGPARRPSSVARHGGAGGPDAAGTATAAGLLALPDTRERSATASRRGSPAGKAFVMLADHHHDDRVGFWAAAPRASRAASSPTTRTATSCRRTSGGVAGSGSGSTCRTSTGTGSSRSCRTRSAPSRHGRCSRGSTRREPVAGAGPPGAQAEPFCSSGVARRTTRRVHAPR